MNVINEYRQLWNCQSRLSRAISVWNPLEPSFSLHCDLWKLKMQIIWMRAAWKFAILQPENHWNRVILEQHKRNVFPHRWLGFHVRSQFASEKKSCIVKCLQQASSRSTLEDVGCQTVLLSHYELKNQMLLMFCVSTSRLAFSCNNQKSKTLPFDQHFSSYFFRASWRNSALDMKRIELL